MGLAPMPIPCSCSTIACSSEPTQPRATRKPSRFCCHRRGHSSPEPEGPAMLSRRAFLQSSSLLALAPSVPLFLARTARAAPTDRDGRVLVVVQLDGGND